MFLHAPSAVGDDTRQRQHSQKLDDRIEPTIGRDGVLVRVHVLTVNDVELFGAFPLAIEQLQYDNAHDMLLQIRVDARDGNADTAVAVRHRTAGVDACQYAPQHDAE